MLTYVCQKSLVFPGELGYNNGMQTKLKIIGLSGTNGSGKDLAGELIAGRHGYLFVSVTDIMRDELMRRGLPPERQHMRTLSAELRRQHGMGVLVNLAVERFTQAGERYKGVVMASLRNPFEADEVHHLGGTMVWLDADPHVRYDRVRSHVRANRGLDDQKSFEAFLADEQAEMHQSGDEATLNMSAVRDRCDVKVQNDGDDPVAFAADLDRALGFTS
jgi:cytidylate kinase